MGIWDGEMQEESKHFPVEITDSRLIAVMVGRSRGLMACLSECRVLAISGMVHRR